MVELDASGSEIARGAVRPDRLAAEVSRRESEVGPRWVWSDTTAWYPRLLAAGVTVQRCHDLRLVHRILRHSQLVREPSAIWAAEAWDTPLAPHVPERDTGATLCDLEAG